MEEVDGFAVDSYGGRFSTSVFDLSEDASHDLRYDDSVLLVVVGRVQIPNFKESSSGGIKRISVVRPDDVVVLAEHGDPEVTELKSRLLSLLGHVEQMKLETEPDRSEDIIAKQTPVEQPEESPEVVPGESRESRRQIPEDVFNPTEVERQHPSPSTVGAGQSERDPVLASFLQGGE